MTWMRKEVLLVSFFCMLATRLAAQKQNEDLTAIDFTARTVDGKKIQLKKLLEKGPVLLDFWALWCVPCLKELPQFQKLHNKYRKRGLAVVAINEDSPNDQAKVKMYIKQKRLRFIVIVDEDRTLWRRFKIVALPSSFLIDRDGQIVYTHTGYKPGDVQHFYKKIEALFNSGNKH